MTTKYKLQMYGRQDSDIQDLMLISLKSKQSRKVLSLVLDDSKRTNKDGSYRKTYYSDFSQTDISILKNRPLVDLKTSNIDLAHKKMLKDLLVYTSSVLDDTLVIHELTKLQLL